MATQAPSPLYTDHRFSVRVDYFATLADAQAYAAASEYRCDVRTQACPPSENDTQAGREYNERCAGRYAVTVHDRPGEGWFG